MWAQHLRCSYQFYPQLLSVAISLSLRSPAPPLNSSPNYPAAKGVPSGGQPCFWWPGGEGRGVVRPPAWPRGIAADICALPPPPARVLVYCCGHSLASPLCTGFSGHLSWALRPRAFCSYSQAQLWLPIQSHHAGLEPAVCGHEGAGQMAFASEHFSLQTSVSFLP